MSARNTYRDTVAVKAQAGQATVESPSATRDGNGNGNGRYDRRLAEILEHATLVFGERGYDGASIRDISRASGTSLAGLYYYFGSKEQLLYLIQRDAFQTLLATLDAGLERVSDPVERVRFLVRNHLEYFLAHPARMKVLSRESETLRGPLQDEVAELKRQYYRRAMSIAAEVQPRDDSASRRVAVMSLFGMMNWVYTWHRPGVDPNAAELSSQVAGIFLNGIPKGEVSKEGATNERQRNGRN